MRSASAGISHPGKALSSRLNKPTSHDSTPDVFLCVHAVFHASVARFSPPEFLPLARQPMPSRRRTQVSSWLQDDLFVQPIRLTGATYPAAACVGIRQPATTQARVCSSALRLVRFDCRQVQRSACARIVRAFFHVASNLSLWHC